VPLIERKKALIKCRKRSLVVLILLIENEPLKSNCVSWVLIIKRSNEDIQIIKRFII
jgi:hypothetical protein